MRYDYTHETDYIPCVGEDVDEPELSHFAGPSGNLYYHFGKLFVLSAEV